MFFNSLFLEPRQTKNLFCILLPRFFPVKEFTVLMLKYGASFFKKSEISVACHEHKRFASALAIVISVLVIFH